MKNKLRVKTIIAAFILAITACVAFSGCGESGTVEQENYITIGCVCPLSGELAAFGEGSLETEEETVEQINEEGGVYIDTLERKLKIRFVIADSLSTEEGAKQAAEHLIKDEAANMVICATGGKTALAAASVCEASKVPFFSVGCENSAWLDSGSHAYAFNCGFSNETRLAALYDMWQEQGVASVALIATASDEAERFAAVFSEFCDSHDLKYVVPDFLDPEDPDFEAAMDEFPRKGVDALVCYMDCGTFSFGFHEGGLKNESLKMCVLVHDPLTEKDLAAIQHGVDIKEFYTLTCWDKTYPLVSSLTEEDARTLDLWWADRFLSSSSELLGFKHASSELAINSVKLAMALDADSIRSAAESLNVDTVLGLVDFDSSNSSVIPCSVLRWNFNTATVSWNKELVSHTQLKDIEFEEDE